MRHCIALSIALFLAFTALADPKPLKLTAADRAERDRVRAIHKEAYAKPFDQARLQRFLETLPRFGDYYIVEGDMLMTEQEVRAYVVAKATVEQTVERNGELLVDMRNGRRNYYADAASRTLIYVVDRNSFGAEYAGFVTLFKRATKEWIDICQECNIRFVHNEPGDIDPENATTNFIIRRERIPGYIALAFFPHDPPAERYLRIDPSFFTETSYDDVGVLRHEIGHILGYRHEQNVSTDTGCFEVKDPQTGAAIGWAPLTDYDPLSVMHYPCGSVGSTTFMITEKDREGHRDLYLGQRLTSASPPAVVPASTVLSAGLMAPAPDASVRRTFERAFSRPFDEESVRAVQSVLPRDGDFYVVEGDILMTEQEVRAWLVAQSAAAEPATTSPELLVSVVGQQPNFHSDPKKRTLTYAIDQNSFPEEHRSRIAENMTLAGRRWEDACDSCGLKFQHLSDYDTSVDAANHVYFVVRFHDSRGAYLASAFFPHDPPERRVLRIDPGYFVTQANKTGILRHELGHILGYRHEHIQGIPGCYAEGGAWKPLTSYDPKSVMHYLCGDGGTLTLDLSTLDRAGHRKLYGLTERDKTRTIDPLLATTMPVCEATTSEQCVTFTVRLEGGDMPSDAALVLSTLQKQGLLMERTHRVNKGETIETIYTRELNLPGFDPKRMYMLARSFNPRMSLSDLEIDQAVKLPEVQFGNYEWLRQVDKSDPTDVGWLDRLSEEKEKEKRWQYMQYRTVREDDRWKEVALTGYELTFSVPRSKLDSVKAALSKIASKNIKPIPPPDPDVPLFTSRNSVAMFNELPPNLMLNLGDQGFTGYALGMNEPPRCTNRCAVPGANCPQVVLFDVPVRIHPDLSGNIEQGGIPDVVAEPIVVGGNQQRLVVADADKALDHGTEIAGLIASREDNGFGLIGLNPLAKIYSYDWPGDYSRRHQRMADEITQRGERAASQLFVFASKWNSRESSVLSDTIRNQRRNLWIVAAGDAQAGANGIEIKDDDVNAPMNLGTEPNVLVVTSCSNCFMSDPHLSTQSNYSTRGHVGIAAPGEEAYPTTITRGRYTKRMGGTSQATAYVAGVVSAMSSCWEGYRDANRAKFHLLVTASPTFRGRDAERIMSGVINAKLAIESEPERSYVDVIDQNGTRTGMMQFVPGTWCVRQLELYDPVTDRDYGGIPVDQIRRVVKPWTDRDEWVVYYSDGGSNPASLKRSKPGAIRDPERVRLRRQGGPPIRVDQAVDLLFSTPTLYAACDGM